MTRTPFPPDASPCNLPFKAAAAQRRDIGENAMRHLVSAIVLIAGSLAFASPSAAKVVKFEITRVESPAFEQGDSVAAVAKAAQQLVQDRLLLEEDAKLFAPDVN